MTGCQQLKTISQETFDAVVRENIDDFEMEGEEALSDAIQQFKSQGVNLNIIIKEVPEKGKHKVISLTETLSLIVNEEKFWDEDSTGETIRQLKDELSSDLSKRYQACKTSDITRNLFRLCILSSEKSRYQQDSFKAYCSLVAGQPDEATPEHMEFFMQNLKETEDQFLAEIICCILKNLCTMQENNRQTLVKMSIIPTLMNTMEKFIGTVSVVRECCGALRALTLDDDVRVQFGKSHDHTKMIVTEDNGLQRFVDVFKEHYKDPVISREVASTLSKVMVRNEFCQEFIDLGGFTALKNAVVDHTAIVGVVRQCVNLLQAISRNDDVKIFVMKNGVVELMVEILDRYIANPAICESCFAALTTLCLRNPRHCKLIVDAKIAPIVIQSMKVHESHAGVQKEACMLIRNVVARTREYSLLFLEQGAEELIRNARTKHSKALDDQAKAALRDLDLEVDLKQLWTGTAPGVVN